SLDQPGREPQAESVQDEEKESQRHQRERQRQEDQHRPDDGIDDRQHETRRQHGQTAADFDPRQDIGGGEDRQRIREHPDQKAHAAPFKRAYFFYSSNALDV